jgi:hypothetical protein
VADVATLARASKTKAKVEMPKYEHTQIYQLDNPHEVDLFCAVVREMATLAPRSLRLRVAVTAEREVTFLARDPEREPMVHHPGEDLERLNRVLAEVRKRRSLEARKAKRRKRRRRRR